MHKFTLVFNSDSNEENSYKNTMEFTSENWFTALDHFILFLRGSGFNIPDGTVAVDTESFPFIPDDIFSLGTFSSKDSNVEDCVESPDLP